MSRGIAAAIACGWLLAGAAQAGAATLRVESDLDPTTVDPALSYSVGGWQLEYATCLKLLNSADASGPAGSVLVPEAAAALPAVSADGRTYTFTVRDGMRFSPPSGELVDAQTFKHAIERVLAFAGDGALFFDDVVGAGAVMNGTATTASGIVASEQTLTITLQQARPDFLDRIAMPFACAVPRDTPDTPVGAPLA